jgi:ArsR family transcriptional regulator
MVQWLQSPGLALETALDLAPPRRSGGTEALTVTLWLARDPRVAIAGQAPREVA